MIEVYIISTEEEKGFKKAFDTTITPELWVARNGHQILSGDLRDHTFPDKEFEGWIHKVYHLLHNDKRNELMEKLLSTEEIAEIEKEEQEMNF